MALNIINFSNGIRPEEIQDNFEYLQEQISRERLSVGGSGIASGLGIKPIINDTTFAIEISDGVVIDKDGEEIFIKGRTLDVNPPEIQSQIEFVNLSEERTVSLKHKPYALNRRRPVQYTNNLEPEYSGIKVKYRNSLNQDDYIRVRGIVDRTLTIAGAISKELEVQYRYTAKRIDIVYINDKLELKVVPAGITSTTPSAELIPNDIQFLIAYIMIDHEYKDEEDKTPHAYIYVLNDLRTIRNIYTDDNGELYICGMPFDDLQIIHLQEPLEPKEHSLWLNLVDNTLYVWRSTDEFIYKNKIDVSTDFVNNANANYVFGTYMDFGMNTGELSVFLNGAILIAGRDYEELSKTLPTAAANRGDSERGNSFRILQSIERPDGYSDVLIPGDVITYTIRYKDSQFMWVPINKQEYMNVKNTKVYCTRYEGISNEYLNDNNEAYFDSDLADSLDLPEEERPSGYYPHKYQYFLFDRIKDMNMHFTPGRKELSVMINQMFLHEDQFKEITVYDLEGSGNLELPSEVIAAAASHFGWTTDQNGQVINFNGEYDNSGIGFMLVEPLDSGANAEGANSWLDYNGSNDLFVEAIVHHRVCAVPLNRKLERSATFVLEDTFTVDDSFNGIVDLGKARYRFDEHQLEVFVNGLKQVAGTDYKEQFGFYKENSKDVSTDDIIEPPMLEYVEGEGDVLPQDYTGDQSYFLYKKAAVCSKFEFIKDVPIDSVVTYKITTNIYSYDHINNILDGMVDDLESCKKTVNEFSTSIEKFQEEVTSDLATVKEKVNEISSLDDEFLTHESILNIGQMPPEIVKNAIKSLTHINTFVTLNAGQMTYTLQDIWPEDYVNVFYHSPLNDSYWVPGLHYKLNAVGTTSCYLEILETTSFDTGDILYLTGLKLSGTGREIS